MDNNIQPDKVIPDERLKAESSKAQNSPQTSNIKDSLPIGKILQDTIKLLSSEGLESINVLKAMLSVKGLFPSEFTQIQLQENQAQIDKADTKITTFKPVSEATKNDWFNGQVIHAKVLEVHADNRASILIDKQVIEIKIEANSQLKLEAGQNLALVVEKIPVEKTSVKSPLNSETIRFILSTPPEQSTKLIQLIQTMVARQQSLSPLLASLDSVLQYINSQQENSNITATINNNKTAKLPAPIINAIQQLLSQFSSTQQLSISDGLKQAIINSGLFLENRIQIQKTDSIDLNNLLSNQKITANKSASPSVLSKTIEKLESISHNFSQRINSKITIASDIIQLFNKNTASTLQNTLDLKDPAVNKILELKNGLKLNTQVTTISNLFSKLNEVNQFVEKTMPQQSTINAYPKAYSQSINQILEVISKQFNEKNHTLLASKNHSYAQTQATQFSTQIQQINQALNQAISNNTVQTAVNPQINNDLKLNLQRLLSVLQELTTTDRSYSPTSQSKNKLASSLLLQHITSQEPELHRLVLPTRNKHAQVIMAQQSQLLQNTNPMIFQQTLIEQLEGVMSRIVATQAATREQSDSNINMALEIPFKFQDKSHVLQLKFTSKDKHKNKSKDKIWSANLAFELQSLGAIRIYIVLDGKDVSMRFWTEKQSTQQIFAENFPLLKDRLKIAGYRINEMTASLGIPKEAEKESAKNKNGIIDEHV